MQVSIAQEGVAVADDIALQIQQVGAQVHHVQRRDAVAGQVMLDVVPGAHVVLRENRCRIADSGWPPEREHQIVALRDPPAGKGQSQIGIVLFQVHLAGHIKQAGDTQSAVDRETTKVVTGMPPAPLQHTVETAAKIPQVLKKAGYRVIEPARRRLAIALGRRLEGILVECFVEGKDLAVDVFPGVVILGLTALGRIKRSGRVSPVFLFRHHGTGNAQQYGQQ